MTLQDELLIRLAKQLDERRYGKFRAIVTDTSDPQKRARLRARLPSVLGDQESDWALPCLPYGGGSKFGLFLVPPVGAQIWMEFEEGDIHRPLWSGTFWQDQADVPADAAKSSPSSLLLQTPGGHVLELDDEDGHEHVRLEHKGGAKLTIDEKGSIQLIDANGTVITLDADGGTLQIEDANGNKLAMDSAGIALEDANGNSFKAASSGITVKGQQIVLEGSEVALGGQGGEPVIKGRSFLQLFATHTHPTGMGPSGPPIPQGEMSSLSTKVMAG